MARWNPGKVPRMKTASAKGEPQTRLICHARGNTHRFIEVMAKKAHVVDGNLNYVGLFEAVADRYVWVECGLTITMKELQKKWRLDAMQQAGTF